MNGKRNLSVKTSVLSHHQKPPMNRHQPYLPFTTCPLTFWVHPWPCPVIATDPYRPTACVHERHIVPRPTANYSLLTANWSFTFSAKERDSETGLSYFGSRYYSSDLSIWLSVDPMDHKYPSLSPYVYCNNNPLSLIDFYGEDFVDFMNRLLEEPPQPPTDQNNPQELPEVVITPKPSSNTSSKNENVALNTKSKATVLTLPFPFVLGNVIECITAAVSPVWSILSVFPALFKGDTRTELPPVTMQMSNVE